MKKAVHAIIAVILVLFLVGCFNDNPEAAKPNEDSKQPIVKPGDSNEKPEESNDTPSYFITFKNEDDELISSIEVSKNKIPTLTYIPKNTSEYKKEFIGWGTSKESSEVLKVLPEVSKETTYYAKVKLTKQIYTINIYSGNEKITSINKEYGDLITELPTRKKDGYRFVGFSYDKEGKNITKLPFTITSNVIVYENWNEKSNLLGYLKELVTQSKVSPMSYIPKTMMPESRVGNSKNLNSDYSTYKTISQINYNGFGEQWQMVLDNLNQSQVFFDVLNLSEGIITTSITAFNNYLDNNPSNENEFTFKNGKYIVDIKYADGILKYELKYIGNILLLGEQEIEVTMQYNITSKEKEVRIQLGKENVLKYQISNDSYKFGIKYLGVRRALFEISRSQVETKASIYEILATTVAGKEVEYKSAAEFTINKDYVTVVGNKADGIIGMKNSIVELYDSKLGKLIGYEVREERSKLKYNTLWFNLDKQIGIEGLVEKTSDKNEKTIEINPTGKQFETKLVGGFSAKSLSRRYDIEFRKQYLYTTENGKLVKQEVLVPMLFVQEENYTTLTSDVREKNKELSIFNLNVSSKDIDKLKQDYSELIEQFNQNKTDFNQKIVIDYIQ